MSKVEVVRFCVVHEDGETQVVEFKVQSAHPMKHELVEEKLGSILEEIKTSGTFEVYRLAAPEIWEIVSTRKAVRR